MIFSIIIILVCLSSVFGSDKNYFSTTFSLPFNSDNYTITSPFGTRTDPINGATSYHSGIDVVPTSTDIILAIADGTVVTSSINDSCGEYVIIEHKVNGQLYRSHYYHLKENSRIVKAGDIVKQGQQIGIMGATGRVTGPHLHLTLQKFNTDKQIFEDTDPSLVFESNKKEETKFEVPITPPSIEHSSFK